jgi:phosphatidylserine decarboxylase
MHCKDREGRIIHKDNGQDNFLKGLYGTVLGRKFLKILINPTISKLGGAVLSTKLSSLLVKPFIKTNNIDMSDYTERAYVSFNDFFTRDLKPGKRFINRDKEVLISPSDGRVSVYEIDDNMTFNIKDSYYTIESLTHSKKAANYYKGGTCVIIRLCVDNYHRYCYIDNGYKTTNKFIEGVLHTVNPVACEYYDIYKENSRECSLLHTENFGKVMQIEVGALMVGKIVNYDQVACIHRGDEKGKFEFGGSTIVLLFKKDTVDIDDDLIENTKNGYETAVKMGERIGKQIFS